MTIRIEGLSRRAGMRTLLDRLSLEIRDGEFLTLLGPAGSGRAALLRCLAGLEEPDAGRILLDGRDITRLPPRRRGIGFVFQHDPVFNHATVHDAVAAACAGAIDPLDEAADRRTDRLLELIGLAEDAGWPPASLPPAGRHRLALARALATDPKVLLLGEGFAALDRAARPAPRGWLRPVHARLGLTTVLVAHDAAEALALGDRVAVLREGRVVQIGTPAELRRRPADALVAELLGEAAANTATRRRGAAGRELQAAQAMALLPQDLEVVGLAEGTPAKVLGSRTRGVARRILLELLDDGSRIEAEMPGFGAGMPPPPGTLVGVRMRTPGEGFGRAH